ncbi:MAG: RNA 2',3'-cyclic phosphodiesterase [Eubacteriales bacterium]|jgi:2'-5' RNA ligase|nr:RNA 2',3'-cyclic phosphodiesterase [Clostridiales bacterium]
MRLFVALLFTPEIKAELTAAIEKLRKNAIRGNFTIPDNLHLTLAFIGETNRALDVLQAMREAGPEAFELILSGWGRFKRSGGDIVWAGVAENRPLAEYAGRLADVLRRRGFDIERRPFRPHITLGRQVVLTEELDLDIKPLSMRCDRISLMRSDRIAGRLKYTEIRAIKV